MAHPFRWEEERRFGYMMAFVLLLLDGLWWYKAYNSAAAGDPAAAAHYATLAKVFGGVGLLMASLGLVAPRILWPVHKGWMAFSEFLALVFTRIVLTVVYLLVVTPIAQVFRWRGVDPIDRKIEPQRESYWNKRPEEPFDRTRYERQY